MAHTVDELKAMGVLTRGALAVYCRFVVLFTEASALLQREPLVIEGDRGCRVRNPALIVQRDAAQMMLKLAARRAWHAAGLLRTSRGPNEIDNGDNEVVVRSRS